MSTRSTISYQGLDGTTTGIYCHSDGYPSWNGRLILHHHNSHEAAVILVNLGDLSCINTLGTAISYCHQKHEEWEEVKPTTHATFSEFCDYWGEAYIEWHYHWKEGQWYVMSAEQDKLDLLGTIIKSDLENYALKTI